MKQDWDFDPLIDTRKSYQAFSHYRGLGPHRTLNAAFALHKGHLEGTQTAPRYFKRWSSQSNWVARADAWDLHLQQVAIAQHEEAIATELRKALNELSDFGINLGQAQLNLANRVAQIVNKELDLWESEFIDTETLPPESPYEVEEGRKPRYQDAIALLKALPMLRSDGQDAWAKALQIDKLLDDMETKSMRENDLPNGIGWTRFVEAPTTDETLDFE